MKRTLVVVALIATTVALTSTAEARRKHHGHHRTHSRSVHVHHPVGYRVSVLPRGYTTLRVGSTRYHYHVGTFYRPYRPGYVVVRAPIGAVVPALPYGYVAFEVGPVRYYRAHGIHYLWDGEAGGYRVVEAPVGTVEPAPPEPPLEAGPFIYPARGQSPETQERDRYECYLWASEQTGFEPSAPAGSPTEAEAYERALTACLTGRGYSVR